MAARQPAPGGLGVIEAFVNTLEIDYDQRDEHLATPDELRSWLEERELIEPGAGITEDEVALVHGFRADLRSLLLGNNGAPVDDETLDRLNRAATEAPLRVNVLGAAEARLEPARAGVPGALSRILGIVFAAMAEGSWARLKACRNDECTWVFYDASKNHSATWCSMRVCGNRMKARAYRRRQAEDRHA